MLFPPNVTPDALLMRASTFSSYGGIAAILSSEAKAVQKIVAAPNARPRLLKLVKSATLEGKLFAVVGLRKVDRARANRLLIEMSRTPQRQVEVQRGCIVGREPFAKIAKEIGKGEWDDILRPETRGRAARLTGGYHAGDLR